MESKKSDLNFSKGPYICNHVEKLPGELDVSLAVWKRIDPAHSGLQRLIGYFPQWACKDF